MSMKLPLQPPPELRYARALHEPAALPLPPPPEVVVPPEPATVRYRRLRSITADPSEPETDPGGLGPTA